MLKKIVLVAFVVTLTGCAADGGFDTHKALTVGAGVLQATTLDENSVKQTAALAAKELDNKSTLASEDSPYTIRVNKLMRNLRNYDGMTLNYKVYINKELNAFAMADGTVRVYSGLLDAMPDDQVLAVLCHEIGHAKLKHSYKQMKERLLTDAAFQAAVSAGGTIGALTSSQLGQLGHAAVTARFSQSDELEADAYAVRTLKKLGRDPWAMKRAIETLQNRYGSGGGFLSSHPSNPKRIEHIEEVIRNG